MKRGGPLRRKTPLAGQAQPLTRSTGLRRVGRPVNPPRSSDGSIFDPRANAKAAVEFWQDQTLRAVVFTLDGGLCCGCGRALRMDGSRWNWVAHHVIQKQHLPKELHGDPESACLLCRRCHERHHSRTSPVPRERLPRRNLDFAARLGAWAEVRLESAHP